MNLGQENLQVLLLERVINKNKWKQRLHYYLCRLQEGIWFINRDVLIETLALYGIPKKIIGVIKGMHTNKSSRVTRLDGKTDNFNKVAGDLNKVAGDTLAPFLFILVLDYILHISLDAEKKNKKQKTKKNKKDRTLQKDSKLNLDSLLTTTNLLMTWLYQAIL